MTSRLLPAETISTVPFWSAFVVTVVLLVAALCTGLTGRRRLHLVLGPAVMVALAITIVLTEELAERYQFPAEMLGIHLWLAYSAVLLAVPVAATGVWLWRQPRARRWHRLCVWVWLAAVLTATGTGFWMFSQSELKAG